MAQALERDDPHRCGEKEVVCFLTHTEAFGVIILPLGHDDPAACVLYTGQHTVSVADVFEGAATTGLHALITRHGMTVGRRLVRRARKKKTVDASVRGRVLLFVCTAPGASPSAYHPTSLVASCCGWSQQVS